MLSLGKKDKKDKKDKEKDKKDKDKKDKKERLKLSKSPKDTVIAISTPTPLAINTTASISSSPAKDPRISAMQIPVIQESGEFEVDEEDYIRAHVLYDYDPAETDEIPLKVGEVVFIFHKHDSGWWTGECNGKYGIFPGAYVAEDEDQKTRS